LAVAYFGLAKAGLTLASLHPSASPVWPPSGLALAALLLWGPRLWPAIAVGAFLANVTTFGGIATSVAIAAGNTLEAAITAWLLRSLSGGPETLEAPARVVIFAGLTLFPGTMVSATLGVGSLVLSGLAEPAKFGSIWLTWWLGDIGGQLLVTPFVLLWGRSRLPSAADWRELTKLLVGTVAVGLIAFSPMAEQTSVRGALAFLAVVPMLWAALRYEQRDTSTAALVLSCFAIWGVLSNGGPFVRPNLNDSFLLVLAFVISTAVPSLVLSADVAVRRRAESQLRQLHIATEGTVDARTADLRHANQALRMEVDERKRVEAESERRRLQLEGAQRLLDGVQDHAIFMLDAAGNVISWNKGAHRIQGYEADEIVGQHLSIFYTADDRAAGVPEKALATAAREGKYESEAWRLRKDGSQFWSAVVIEAIRDESGALTGFAKITRDISERREARQRLEAARDQLAQSQKMEALGQLTGGIAHDFNNVLAVVLSNLELLRQRAALPIPLLRLVDNSEQAIERATALTQRMLAFARRQDLRPEAVDIAQLVAGMVELLKRTLGSQIIIETKIPCTLPRAMVDANQLELAIMNLTLNARDAMPTGGNLTIVADARILESGCSGLISGHYVRLSVTDTGVGMDLSVLARAGEPFFTTKGVGKGTGLGLAMVQGLAEQSGGRLELESIPAKGTSAIIWLPVAKTVAAIAAEGAQPKLISRPLTILVVDDDPLVLMGTVGMLEDLGHAVVEATTGEAALAVLQSAEPVDVLITDQAMPGMTGTELIKAARAECPGLPVILATGYAEPAGIEAGIPILKKPYLPRALGSAIAQVHKG
jgi:PAS domain S-box-containing protein